VSEIVREFLCGYVKTDSSHTSTTPSTHIYKHTRAHEKLGFASLSLSPSAIPVPMGVLALHNKHISSKTLSYVLSLLLHTTIRHRYTRTHTHTHTHTNSNTLQLQHSNHNHRTTNENNTDTNLLSTLKLPDLVSCQQFLSIPANTLTLNASEYLMRIVLSYNNIGNTGAVLLSTVLSRNVLAHLHTLVLSRNMISAEGFEALCKALHKNTTLTSLDLSENDVSLSSLVYCTHH